MCRWVQLSTLFANPMCIKITPMHCSTSALWHDLQPAGTLIACDSHVYCQKNQAVVSCSCTQLSVSYSLVIMLQFIRCAALFCRWDARTAIHASNAHAASAAHAASDAHAAYGQRCLVPPSRGWVARHAPRAAARPASGRAIPRHAHAACARYGIC